MLQSIAYGAWEDIRICWEALGKRFVRQHPICLNRRRIAILEGLSELKTRSEFAADARDLMREIMERELLVDCGGGGSLPAW